MSGRFASLTLGEMSCGLPRSDGERWYVVRTLPQRELHAAQHLANQGFRAFVPRYWKNRRHARKVETVSAPLFPQYIFTIFDMTRDRWRSVNGTLGVDRVLMSGGEPQPVPHGLVENLHTVRQTLRGMFTSSSPYAKAKV